MNAASAAIARVLNVVILFWAYQYLLRRVSPEEFAIYPILLAIMVFAPLLSFLFTGGVARYVIEAYAKGDLLRVREIVSSVFPVLALTALLLVPLGFAALLGLPHVMPIPEHQIGEARLMFFLMLVNFQFSILLLPMSVGFDVKQRYTLSNALDVLKNICRLVLLVVLLAGLGPRILWVVVATVGTDLALQIVRACLSLRMVPELWPRLRLANRKTARRLVGFGFWTSLGQLVTMIHASAGVFVLSQFGTPVDITVYHVGAMIDRQVRGLTGMVMAPVKPALTAMHATAAQSRIGRAFVKVGRYALWAVLLLAVPLAIYSESFVKLYLGNTYDQAAIVIVLLMATYIFEAPGFLIGAVSVAKERVRYFFTMQMLAQALAVALMIAGLFFTEMGAVAVAAAILLTRIVMNIAVFWPYGFNLTDVSAKLFGRETLFLGLAPAAIGFLAWYGLHLYEPPESWAQLALYTAVGAIAYLVVLLVWCVDEQERTDISWGLAKVTSGLRGCCFRNDLGGA